MVLLKSHGVFAARRRIPRTEQLAELNREAQAVFDQRRHGEITLEQAERMLHDLRRRYKKPFDRFLEVE